jgi:hypothetical protein
MINSRIRIGRSPLLMQSCITKRRNNTGHFLRGTNSGLARSFYKNISKGERSIMALHAASLSEMGSRRAFRREQESALDYSAPTPRAPQLALGMRNALPLSLLLWGILLSPLLF